MIIKIDKDIPIPRRGKNWTAPDSIKNMAVGDSVFVETPAKAAYMRELIIRATGDNAISRRVEGGWRVWRVEHGRSSKARRIEAP